MSGPWDRPSSDDPNRWPTEDLERSDPSSAEAGRRASSERDPGSEGAPGWDDWPAPPPAADDYLIEEPLPPSSDPWAESWTAEEADAMIGASTGEPAPRARWDEPAPQAAEPVAPAWTPGPSEPLESSAQAEMPVQDPGIEPAPRIEPWSPDPDPWRFEPVEPAATLPEPTAEAEAEPEPQDEPEAEPQTPRQSPAWQAPVARWPARSDELPDWLAEPIPEPDPPGEIPSPASSQAPLPSIEAEPPADTEPEPAEPEPEPAEPEPEPAEPEPEPAEPEPAPMAAVDPEPPSVPFWKSILPWRTADADPEPEPESERAPQAQADLAMDAEPEPEPEPEPAPRPEPQPRSAFEAPVPVFEQRWPASVPEPADVDVRAAEPEAPPEDAEEPRSDGAPQQASPTPAPVPLTGGLTYDPVKAWRERDATGAPATIDAEPEPEPEAEPPEAAWTEPEPWTEPEQPQPAAERAPEPEPWRQPEPEPPAEPEPVGATTGGWSDPEWSDRGESTRVLPTDWLPPQPGRADELPELTGGAIRTGLADPDADIEPEESGTVAEQAVPWLIGVILLLAGMVIVLLALIFAGDGSLGGPGAGTPTQSPTFAAVGGGVSTPAATPSMTPAPSATPAASASAAPTATPEPLPEYGPLEMVYQGRSAALAPIYLLRHDFTVADEEPDVLAQDAAIDVRRFAWAPEGRVGAAILADVLVSIEPGEEKRPLGDGLSTVTFGEDASTVYAVRITEDGADDVATVLAIDFASGDTEDLASITYERPDVGAEAALAEARFADDGGPVRLYWTAADRLHLWILGAGAWSVDPEGGTATELDGEPLPVLWSPNGHGRIELSEDGGTTTIILRNANGRDMARTEVDGMVSHVRWSPGSDRVVFTVGRSATGGGILQDLFLWDLGDGEEPMQLTGTGAAFGAEWLGTRPLWRDE